MHSQAHVIFPTTKSPLQDQGSNAPAAKGSESAAPLAKRFQFSDQDAAEAPEGIFGGLRKRVESAGDLAKRVAGREARDESGTGIRSLLGGSVAEDGGKTGVFAGLRRRVASAGASIAQPSASDREGDQGEARWFRFSRESKDEGGEGMFAGLRKRAAAVRDIL